MSFVFFWAFLDIPLSTGSLLGLKWLTEVALLCQIVWLNEGEGMFFKQEKKHRSKETTKLNLPESFATVSLCCFVLVPLERWVF